jgi:hypothetical protein
MTYITDKSKIKNGMFVATQDDVVFVRIGGRLSKIDLNNLYSFDELKQEEIKTIFKSNGNALLEKETETHYEKING